MHCTSIHIMQDIFQKDKGRGGGGAWESQKYIYSYTRILLSIFCLTCYPSTQAFSSSFVVLFTTSRFQIFSSFTSSSILSHEIMYRVAGHIVRRVPTVLSVRGTPSAATPRAASLLMFNIGNVSLRAFSVSAAHLSTESTKHEFKAETRQLLDIVASSLYR